MTDEALIPLAVPNLTGNEARYLAECVETTYVSSVGPFVDRFERMVAQASGSLGAVATSSGTTGLHAALIAVGVERDDLVILPSLTFIAGANSIAHCGAAPWLLDVAADGWTLDPELLAQVLADETEPGPRGPVHRISGRRVAALMPVHTLGLPADMDAIDSIAERHGLPIVADAAAALGARYRGRPLGALGAALSVFSFNGNKTVTAGAGGAVCGTDERLLDLVRHLTTTARRGAEYDHDRVGYNYRMSNLQAAVGCAQMERLEEFVAAKRRIRRRYEAAFADLPDLRPFPAPTWAEGADWFSGFTLDDPRWRGVETDFRSRLRAGGIDARAFWKPIHLQAPYAEAPRSPMPVADGLWRRVITLPCSTGLTEADQDRVIAAVRRTAVEGPRT